MSIASRELHSGPHQLDLLDSSAGLQDQTPRFPRGNYHGGWVVLRECPFEYTVLFRIEESHVHTPEAEVSEGSTGVPS